MPCSRSWPPRAGGGILVLTQGAAAELAVAVAAGLDRVEAAALLCCEPLDERALVTTLSGRKAVVVLERVDSPLDRDPPLLHELRSALARALETGRFHNDPDSPSLALSELPRLHSALYGLGSGTLRPQDLSALCGEVQLGGRQRTILGVDFGTSLSPYPRRQALLDTLHREYPEALASGLRADRDLEAGLAEANSVAILRREEPLLEGMAARVVALLHAANGGSVRSGRAWERLGEEQIELVTQAAERLFAPAPRAQLLVAADPAVLGPAALRHLAEGGAVLVRTALPPDQAAAHLPGETRRRMASLGAPPCGRPTSASPRPCSARWPRCWSARA